MFLEDFFGTNNQFYGGQVGVRAEWWRNRFYAEARTSLAIGGTAQQLQINGFLVETPPPPAAPTTFAGGLLALPGANIGNYSTGRFSFVAETTLNVGYQFLPRLRGFVGYNFLYWTNVMRPGDQIDRNIDVTRVPRFLPPALLAQIAPLVPPQPAVLFKQTDFWAQGLNIGLEFKF